MLAFIFLLAFVLTITVFKEKKVAGQFNSSKQSKEKPKETQTLAKEVPVEDQEEAPNSGNDPGDADALDFEDTAIKTASSPISFETMLQRRADSIRASLSDGKRRTDVILRYYPHLPDGKIVYSLSDLGFYLHERPTEINQLEQPTNALFYGDNVPLADIQMVAYELINRGVKIRQIKMSRFHDDWKANSIEIGSEPSAEQQSVLQLDDIQNFRKANGE
ncbi:MAG: hypothetical protein R8G66_32935 [Cytophagales bacterium]|nr:hypothetical protein [Cytophagales bacterium]